jgi:NADH:ubiquinone oxidoreductase subunit 3 (subunit A)
MHMKGASAQWWKTRHNRHHAKTYFNHFYYLILMCFYGFLIAFVEMFCLQIQILIMIHCLFSEKKCKFVLKPFYVYTYVFEKIGQ